MATRDELRKTIFKNSKPLSKRVVFFGAEIEMRQPPMKTVLELQQLEDKAAAAAQMIVGYAFVPGTDERVFDEADIDVITQMPFGGDLARINKAISELTDIDILGEEGNSAKTPDSSTSSS
jgi:hypothetical protein